MPGFPYAVRAEIAFTGNAMSSSPAYEDVTDRVKNITTKRGRPYFTDSCDAGKGTVVLDNSDGALDPENTTGPHAGSIRPNRRIRISAQQTAASPTTYLFEGYIDSWRRGWPGGGSYSVTTVTATDLFKPLSKNRVSGYAPQTGAASRIRDIADLAGLAFVDGINLGGYSSYTVVGVQYSGDNLLQAMQEAARADGGPLFVSGAGALVYQSSGYRASSPRAASSQGIFGNTVGAIPVQDDLEPIVDDEKLWNVVSITDGNGLTQAYSHGPSIARDGQVLLDLGNTILLQTSAEQRANDVLIRGLSTPVRYDSVTLDALTSDEALAAALNREISDRITLSVQPQGGGSTSTRDQFIESVSHSITPGPGASWTTTFELSAA